MDSLAHYIGNLLHGLWRGADFAPERFFALTSQALASLSLPASELASHFWDGYVTDRGMGPAYTSPDRRFSIDFQFACRQKAAVRPSFPGALTYPILGEALHVRYEFLSTTRLEEGEVILGRLSARQREVIPAGSLYASDGNPEGIYAISPDYFAISFSLGTVPRGRYFSPGLYVEGLEDPKFIKRRRLLAFLQKADPSFPDRFQGVIRSWSVSEKVRHFLRSREEGAPFWLVDQIFEALSPFPELASTLSRVAEENADA